MNKNKKKEIVEEKLIDEENSKSKENKKSHKIKKNKKHHSLKKGMGKIAAIIVILAMLFSISATCIYYIMYYLDM